MIAKGRAPAEPGDILWNFEKFLVDKQGNIIARFSPDMAPDAPQVLKRIEQALTA